MFTAGGAIAVKSMGIEHLPDDKIIISLGYADTQKGYPVKIHEVVMGQLPADDEFDAIDIGEEEAGEPDSDERAVPSIADADWEMLLNDVARRARRERLPVAA